MRARVYDERGAELEGAEAQTRYEVTHGHNGRAEFDADHLVEATRTALDRARRAGEVDAVAMSCFWHSLLAVDASGRALGPLLTWRDQRSAPEADELRDRLDADAVHARTGCVLHPSYWPAKLCWLRRHDSETFRSAARFVSFSDYFGGDGRTSISIASGTGLLDVHRCVWDEELLEILGLEREQLPELSDEPLVFGDGACSNVGAGCVTRDRAALMVGTSGAYRVLFEADRATPRRGLFLYRLDRRRFVEGGALSDGGNLWAWLHDTLRLEPSADATERPPGAHGLVFLPLLGGERAPGWKGAARGALAGLSFDTEPLDILQAALEGIAFRFAAIAELLPEVEDVVATGHALAASPGWVQILADVLERPVTLSAVEEGSARGAAVAALERLGFEPEPAPLGRVFEPRPERSETYREARERQRQLYDAVT